MNSLDLNNLSIKYLYDKIRPYLNDLGLAEDALPDVDWKRMTGTWYEVGRTNNDFQNSCGRSILMLNKKEDTCHYCYSRYYFTNGDVTLKKSGVAVPSDLPFAVSFKPSDLSRSAATNFPNFYVVWNDYEFSIWLAMSNFWIFSKKECITQEEFDYIISHLPEKVRCRVVRTWKYPIPKCFK